jgi:hypothetical protein
MAASDTGGTVSSGIKVGRSPVKQPARAKALMQAMARKLTLRCDVTVEA